MSGQVALGGDWDLWRDFAVRSAGFPVGGLEVFGPGDEAGRLRAAAGDSRFREAVAWQNPAALANAVDRVAAGGRANSDHRRREEIVAAYWQRYHAKNDTIGFFGPLSWGTVDPDGPALGVRCGALVRERAVHFEAWTVQALAAALDVDLRVPGGPWPERDLRAMLEAHPNAGLRERGLAALDRLEAARDAVAAAPPDELVGALARLDDVFVELTGREPVRNPGRAYGARTLSYLDCLRDLDVTLGRQVLDDLWPVLQLVFEAGRWYTGQVNAIGVSVIEAALPAGGSGPFGPLAGRVLGTLMALPPALADAGAELQRRVAELLRDPDPATLPVRAAAAFADHVPGWPHGVFQSADIQVAADSVDAVAAGDFLAVVADVHPGANPLMQGLFAHRHPDPEGFDRAFAEAVGPRWALLLPPWGPGLALDARGLPRTGPSTIHISLAPETLAQGGRRTWQAAELLVDGMDLVDRAGELRLPLAEVFALPIFVSGVRTFELFPPGAHADRLTIGRVVLRRETWNVPAGEIPPGAGELGAWGRARGMPRRVFVKTPDERKPFLLDLDSAVLARMAARHIRHAAAQDPGAPIRFNEMLPGPEECWLADGDGGRYACELRLVAVEPRD